MWRDIQWHEDAEDPQWATESEDENDGNQEKSDEWSARVDSDAEDPQWATESEDENDGNQENSDKWSARVDSDARSRDFVYSADNELCRGLAKLWREDFGLEFVETDSVEADSRESDSSKAGLDPSSDDSPNIPEVSQEKADESIEAILDSERFASFKDQFSRLRLRTELLKRQGVHLAPEASSMSVTLIDTDYDDNLEFAKNYHSFLEASGYFSSGFGFWSISAKDNCCLQFFSDDKEWTETSGTIFIYLVDSLCSTGAQCLTDIIKQCRKLCFVLVSQDASDFLSSVEHRFALQLQLGEVPFQRRAQLALNGILDALEGRFHGKCRIEDGPEGQYIQVCARRVARQAEAGENMMEELIEVALAAVYRRQFDRLYQSEDGSNEAGETAELDEFLLTGEDMIGPVPDANDMRSKPWKELEAMIGMDSVKSSLRSIVERMNVNYYRELRGEEPLQIGLSRLFLGPPGTGKTTVAKLYGQFLADHGTLSCGDLIVKNAADFEDSIITKLILSEARGKVLVIDEAYQLHPKSRPQVIDIIVGQVQNTPGEDICVIMCGYPEEMSQLLQESNPGVSRRFPIADAFRFEEFNDDQLEAILDFKMKQENLSMTDGARKVAMEALRLAKLRPNFGNGGEVDNLLSRAKTNFSHRFNKLSADLRHQKICFEPEDFNPEYASIGDAEGEVEKQFKDFVGLDSQIDKFRGFARRVVAMRKRGVDPKQFIPFGFVFKGPPGTGKTTAARKVGFLYYRMGLLPTAEVVEASVKDMTAEYLGQTVQKTHTLMERALGKVLFIDEAYRLGMTGSGSQYLQEARDELVDGMTKPKFMGKMVIVLAGYETDMNALLKANPGLESRFRTHIQFANLSPEACLLLLQRKIEESGVKVKISRTRREKLKECFATLMTSATWGNGRDVESIAREVVSQLFETCEDNELNVSGHLLSKVLNRWLGEGANASPIEQKTEAAPQGEGKGTSSDQPASRQERHQSISGPTRHQFSGPRRQPTITFAS